MIPIFPILFIAGPPLLWALLGQIVPADVPPALTNKAITLVVAHPDDEAMFFGPTVLNLVRPEHKNDLTILSLSNGDAEGLGKIRTNELRNAARTLGVQDVDQHVKVLNHPELKDSMDNVWDPDTVAKVLEENVKSDVVITFDSQGISGHSNHKSCYQGAIKWRTTNLAKRSLWVLRSVPIYRKYLSMIDALVSHAHKQVAELQGWEVPKEHLMVNYQADVAKTKNAMIKGHASQMKWYRWFYLQFSRYVVVNDLLQI